MTFLARFGAFSGLATAICLAIPGSVEIFTGETLATSLAIGLSPALAIPLLVALYMGQPTRGAAAFAVNLIGLGLFGAAAFALNVVVFPPGVGVELAPVSRIALLASAVVFVAGVVLFGLAMLRARVYPRPAVWPYLLGFPPLALAAPLPDSPLTSALHVVAGTAVAWLSVAVLPKGGEWTWTTSAPAASPAG